MSSIYFGFQNIKINFGKRELLEDITVSFPENKITSIIGKNGCGKSTLLKTITNQIKPLAGSVIFCDKDIKTFKRKEVSQRLAIVPQVHFMPYDLTVRQLVELGRFPHLSFLQRMRRIDNKIIDEILTDTAIKHLENRRVVTLSGGERQRAWIALALAQEPEILILDEPTTHLDIGYQIEVLELVRKLNQTKKMTIIMVLHDINLAARFSDYLCVINHGKVKMFDTPCNLLTEELLEELFQIKSDVLFDGKSKCSYFIPHKSIKKESELYEEKNK